MLHIRLGSRFLFIHTYDIQRLIDFYTNTLDGIALSFEDAFNRATEHCTIIFLVPPRGEKTITSVDEIPSIIYYPHGSSLAHSELFNHGLAHQVESTQLGPGSIVMRVPKSGGGLYSEISNTYDTQTMDITDAIFVGTREDTILSITNQSLHLPIQIDGPLVRPLLVHENVTSLFDKLRKDGLLYITKELEDNQWCELKINIYDANGEYDKHYARLVHVLTQLDLGMILGESWTRDHALALFSVLAYQVRFFTLYPPIEIKAILKGLEYDENGKRLVDFDLYYKNKKVSAAQLKTDDDSRLKEQKGVFFRKKLMEQLPPRSVEYLKRLEG